MGPHGCTAEEVDRQKIHGHVGGGMFLKLDPSLLLVFLRAREVSVLALATRPRHFHAFVCRVTAPQHQLSVATARPSR